MNAKALLKPKVRSQKSKADWENRGTNRRVFIGLRLSAFLQAENK
jgi:hypothetical protein